MKNSDKRFSDQKKFAMSRLEKAINKGEVDHAILSLIKYINSLDDFYTTSTCSGRIALLQDVGSKKENFHLAKWHRNVKFPELKSVIMGLPTKGITWFIQESSIMHIVSRNFDGGANLLRLALSNGFKHSGFQGLKDGRFVVEICSSERMEVPIASNGSLLVSDEYLRYLLNLANKKFSKSQQRLKKFEKVLKRKLREC
ncbi:MAG: hypothetical protein QXY62_05815 [Candidatus Altiarchaeota archaeon]